MVVLEVQENSSDRVFAYKLLRGRLHKAMPAERRLEALEAPVFPTHPEINLIGRVTYRDGLSME